MSYHKKGNYERWCSHCDGLLCEHLDWSCTSTLCNNKDMENLRCQILKGGLIDIQSYFVVILEQGHRMDLYQVLISYDTQIYDFSNYFCS